MKKLIATTLCALLVFTAACVTDTQVQVSSDERETGQIQPGSTVPEETPTEPDDSKPDTAPPDGPIQATITMEDGGVIVVELYPDIAPQSVYNFVYLARQGFYDGLKFHRIINGFMIQGGCPDSTGTGGPGYSIFGEFRDNDFANDLLHTRGVLSMARSASYNSAGSQFFIIHDDAPFLDGSYAAFGKVISGIEVVDRIADTPNSGANGAVAGKDMPVIKSITIDSDVELPEPDKLPR